MLFEVPEQLVGSLKAFLSQRSDWTEEQAITAALSLFLLQECGRSGIDSSGITVGRRRGLARLYLDSMFKKEKR